MQSRDVWNAIPPLYTHYSFAGNNEAKHRLKGGNRRENRKIVSSEFRPLVQVESPDPVFAAQLKTCRNRMTETLFNVQPNMQGSWDGHTPAESCLGACSSLMHNPGHVMLPCRTTRLH